jgi:uncharacterized membrane protein YphA (DoxX/SURF4 family)
VSDAILIGVRILLAGVLLRAALGKIRAPEMALAMARGLVPRGSVAVAAVALGVTVSLEVAAAACLLVGAAPSATAVAIVVMMSGFSVIVVVARRRGEVGGCGCFGEPAAASTASPLARNTALAVCAAAIAVADELRWVESGSVPVWRVSARLAAVSTGLAIVSWQFWSAISLLRHVLTDDRND